MAKPTLILAPHELEPSRHEDWDGEPFEFRVRWCGVERDFVGQVVGQRYTPMVFFALADEPEVGNFVSAVVWESNYPDSLLKPIFEPRTEIIPGHSEALTRLIEFGAEKGWGRLFFVNEDLEPIQNQPAHGRLFLSQSGWGQWGAAPDYDGQNARFCWNKNSLEARELTLLPPLELLELLRPSLLNPQSDAAFARQFAVLNGRERHQCCRPLRRGNYDEWEHVLRLYLLSRSTRWKGDKACLSFNVHKSAISREDRWASKGEVRHLSLASTQFLAWMREFFQPDLDEHFLKQSSAAENWSHRSFTLRLRVNSPTQHERLEALFQLRDWLSDKAAPDEIELLLRDG